MNCSTQGFPIHHQLVEFTQTHVHWVGDTTEPSVIPFSSCLQSCPASGSFPMNQFFISGGYSIGASASASVLPMNIQDSLPLRWTGWLSMQFKGLSRVFSNITVQNHQFFGTQLSSQSNSHIHTWLLEKTIALTKWTFVSKVMSLFLNMLSRLVTAFLPRSKHLLISWLQVTIYSDFGAHENKVCNCFHFVYPSIFHVVMGPDAMISVFWMLSFKPGFSLYSFTFTNRLFSSYSLLAKSLVVPQKVQHRITKT